MTIIIKNVYTEEQYEVKEMASYKEAEDYVFTKYNAVYEIKNESKGVTFYVYNN